MSNEIERLERTLVQLQTTKDALAEERDLLAQRVAALEQENEALKQRLASIDRLAVIDKARRAGLTDIDIEIIRG